MKTVFSMRSIWDFDSDEVSQTDGFDPHLLWNIWHLGKSCQARRGCLPSVSYLCLYPFTIHTRLRKNKQNPFVLADSFVYLLVNLFSTLNIMRREPAAHPFVLKVGIKPVCKFLVLGRVTDETGIELYSLAK